VVSVIYLFGSWQSPLSVTTPAVGYRFDRKDATIRVIGSVQPSSAAPPTAAAPSRQLEQRHLRRQLLVQDSGDDIGCGRGQVDHAADTTHTIKSSLVTYKAIHDQQVGPVTRGANNVIADRIAFRIDPSTLV
jgi:hypothetical protein